MHTFDFVARHPLRALGALSALIAAVAVAVGSSASFTATSANPSNTFAAGTLSILNSKEGLAVLTASGMKPGDSATGTVDVQNSGSLSGAFVLSRSNIVDSDAVHPMSAKLDLVVKDCGDFSSGTPTCDVGDPVKYTGTIAAMGSTALGTFAAAEKPIEELYDVRADPDEIHNLAGIAAHRNTLRELRAMVDGFVKENDRLVLPEDPLDIYRGYWGHMPEDPA